MKEKNAKLIANFYKRIIIMKIIYILTHSCHKIQINKKYCLHPFEAKRVQILYISSHIKEGFYIERENFE